LAKSAEDLPPGSRIAGFEVMSVLGRGSFGTVYLAKQGDLADRPVVLKVSPSLQAESRMLARLQHTNIVPIYSVHRSDTLQVVCMPFLGMTTLKDVLDDIRNHVSLPETGYGLISSLLDTQRGDMAPTIRRLESREGLDAEEASEISETPDDRPLPRTLRYLEGLSYVQAVLWIGARLASGLAHAHDRSILHLDLKPANVLLTRDGQPMLLDFNLSLDLKAAERTKGIGGTVIYMSPEQSEAYRGASATVDARSDIYSLGIILHELLTGRRPFPDWAVSSPERMDARLERRGLPTQELRGRNKEVSPAVESIIRHCLEADPARRYQGASELQEDLERQLADLPLKHAPEPSCLERCSKWRRRHPAATRLSTIVAASILAIAGLGALTWQAVSDARRSRARLNSLAFHENFKVCQLLLNTVHLGSQDHLRRGIELADQAVNPFLKPGHSGRETQPLLPELTGDEEIAFRAELAELIMLQVRARVALTDSSPPLEGRRWVLEWGLEKLGLAGRIDPTPPAAYFHDRAHLYSLLGREKEAAEDRRRFESTPLRDARDHYLAGTAFLSLRRPDRAEHFLSRAVELAPGQFWTWFALGLCHSDQGRHADAAADFACSSITAKNLAWPYLNRGLCLARCGRLTEAVSTYGRALEIDPDFVEALVDRGLAFLDLGHPQAALDDLESAFARHSPPPELRAAHAEALSRLKRKADAEAEFAVELVQVA